MPSGDLADRHSVTSNGRFRDNKIHSSARTSGVIDQVDSWLGDPWIYPWEESVNSLLCSDLYGLWEESVTSLLWPRLWEKSVNYLLWPRLCLIVDSWFISPRVLMNVSLSGSEIHVKRINIHHPHPTPPQHTSLHPRQISSLLSWKFLTKWILFKFFKYPKYFILFNIFGGC